MKFKFKKGDLVKRKSYLHMELLLISTNENSKITANRIQFFGPMAKRRTFGKMAWNGWHQVKPLRGTVKPSIGLLASKNFRDILCPNQGRLILTVLILSCYHYGRWLRETCSLNPIEGLWTKKQFVTYSVTYGLDKFSHT